MNSKWHVVEEDENTFRLVVEVESPLRTDLEYRWTSRIRTDADGSLEVDRMDLETVGDGPPEFNLTETDRTRLGTRDIIHPGKNPTELTLGNPQGLSIIG